MTERTLTPHWAPQDYGTPAGAAKADVLARETSPSDAT